ncbi:MAG: hypothetical protein JWO75_4912, partial [Actinomycetia bacterium]|nr:hypothetical protein [Actinomycetes bacterium]
HGLRGEFTRAMRLIHEVHDSPEARVPGVYLEAPPLAPRHAPFHALALPRAGSRVPLTAVIAGHPGGGPGRPAGSPVMPRFPGAAARLFP